MSTQEQWKIRRLERLYSEVTLGCAVIRCEEDARFTAAILRELANDLDPGSNGDATKAKSFVNKVKHLIRFDE